MGQSKRPGMPFLPKQRPNKFGRGIRKSKFGEMTRTEKAYAEILDTMKANGEILEWWFELVTLKLAHDCRYTPDFMVMLADGTIEFHEIKGPFILDEKGIVKAKIAASRFPFVFVIAKQLGKKDNRKWEIRALKAE